MGTEEKLPTIPAARIWRGGLLVTDGKKTVYLPSPEPIRIPEYSK